jgi:hypothetical protein
LIGARYKGIKPHLISALNTDILISILTYFKEKTFLTLYSELLTFLEPKRPFSQEMAKNKEKRTYFVI